MIGNVPVVDAVLHGFNWDPTATQTAPGTVHQHMHVASSSKDAIYSKYVLSRERYEHRFTAEELVSCVFAESLTDIGVYHHVRRVGLELPTGQSSGSAVITEELSPLEVGLKAREIAPGRVLIYGAVSDPFDTERSLEDIDRLVDDNHVIGLKFYPTDWHSALRRMTPFPLDDEGRAFPLLEHAVKRGLKVIAIHKAMGSRLKAFGVSDLENACIAFPQLNFEIVHAGWAFVEDTAILAALPNVYLNLEGTSALLAVAPRRFAEALGRFMRSGVSEPNAEDRILWATGAVFVHPQPLLELFWKFRMPLDLVEGYGFSPMSDSLRRKILAENFARMIGVSLDSLMRKVPQDVYRRRQKDMDLAEPWSAVPA